MEQKAKFIIFGLIGVSIVFIFLFLQGLGSKQMLLRERDDLKKENTSLDAKLGKLQQELRDYQNKISLLNSELDKISREKEEANKRYELANKAREELANQLKSRPLQAAAPQMQAAPIATDAYWAGILKAKTDLELQLDNLRSELKTSQINNEQLQREKSSVELDINNLKHEAEDLRRQLDYNQKLMDSIAQELVREKNDKIRIQDSLKVIKDENVVLTRQLKNLNSRKVSLEKNLLELQGQKASLERQLSEVQTAFKDKASQIDSLREQFEASRSTPEIQTKPQEKESVELPPIVVRPQSTEISTRDISVKLDGKILAVNKDNNFVIIDLGEEAGIKVGDALRVYRGDKPIAIIEAIQTRRNITACDIKKESTAITVGDTIR